MGRKKQIFLQLYTKDYTGDERLRMCSPGAWGVYSYLLCLLNSTAVRGAYRLSKLERRPDLKRSLTQRVLSAPTDAAKIPPFAEILQRQMPWKKTEILRALKELLFYKVIVLEDDALIQPRMYREGGHVLKSEDERVGEDDAQMQEENTDMENGTEKVHKNDNKNDEKSDFPARAIARARSENMSYENINTGDSKGNIGGVGDEKREDEEKQEGRKKKTPEFTPPTLDEVKAYFAERGTTINPEAFWAHYEANGWVQSRGKPIKNWKACLTTWEHRRGEFGDGRGQPSRQRQNDTIMQHHEGAYDDMEEFG